MDQVLENAIENVTNAVAITSVVITLATVVFTTLRRVLATRNQSTVQIKLIDKIDSGQALADLAATEAGRTLLAGLSLERATPRSPYRNILVAAQSGIVLLLLGLTLLLLHATHVLVGPPTVVLGAVPTALGVGFLVAAFATYKLSSSMGLLARSTRD